MRKRFTCFAVACAMAITPVVGSMQPPVNVLAQEVRQMMFKDVTTANTGYKQIKTCYENYWIDGVNSETFNPTGILTRGAFMKILGRYAGVDKTAYEGIVAFADIKEGAYYAPYVAWAVENKITSGKTSTTFAPKDGLARDQVAVFLYKYFMMIAAEEGLEFPVLEGREDMKFSDESRFMKGSANAIYALAKAGVINGKNGEFMPKMICTREQAAIMICNFDNMLQKARAAKAAADVAPLADLGNGALGYRVTSLTQLLNMTHYNNYNDRNTSDAMTHNYVTGETKPVYDGYFTILDEAVLAEIVNCKTGVTVNMSRGGLDDYKYFLLDTNSIELAMMAARKLNLTYKGKNITGLHLQYSQGYAGLNHGMKAMFAIVGDHNDAESSLTNFGKIKGVMEVQVTNPGLRDSVVFENAIGEDGKARTTWDGGTISWEPKDRMARETFQDMVVSYRSDAIVNKDVWDDMYDHTYSVTASHFSGDSGKKTDLTMEAFEFRTEYDVKIELPKPNNYSDYMKKFFKYADGGNAYNQKLNTETSLPYWAAVEATPDRIDVYLSEGASLYYRWRFNDLFYTRCGQAHYSAYTKDKVSCEEDYTKAFMGMNGYIILRRLETELDIEHTGTLPLRDDKYVYVHYNCPEKYKTDKNTKVSVALGLPAYSSDKADVRNGCWSSALIDGKYPTFWFDAYIDFGDGHISNSCTVHPGCGGYTEAGGLGMAAGKSWKTDDEIPPYAGEWTGKDKFPKIASVKIDVEKLQELGVKDISGFPLSLIMSFKA